VRVDRGFFCKIFLHSTTLPAWQRCTTCPFGFLQVWSFFGKVTIRLPLFIVIWMVCASVLWLLQDFAVSQLTKTCQNSVGPMDLGRSHGKICMEHSRILWPYYALGGEESDSNMDMSDAIWWFVAIHTLSFSLSLSLSPFLFPLSLHSVSFGLFRFFSLFFLLSFLLSLSNANTHTYTPCFFDRGG